MSINLKELQKALAKQKVYDAWQYVGSLSETLTYMNASYELLEKVYEHRLTTLSETADEIIKAAIKTGKASVGESELHKTDLNIGGFLIDDSMFLRKTTIEFFHYARISMDVLFQIVNAALLGDESVDVTDRSFLPEVLRGLSRKPEFRKLKIMLVGNRGDDSFKYLQAFDNYIKHIKTILITVKNSFMLGNENTFIINEFTYNGVFHPSVNAIDKVKQVNNYVMQVIEKVLLETQKQIPNCLDTRRRIQTLSFKMTLKKKEKTNSIDYISFFIDVENDITELPPEIKVYPLIIKPNDEIFSFDFKFDTIFIKKRGYGEESIIGCAKMKNDLSTNEFYRIFQVMPCDIAEYHMYIFNFIKNHPSISINFYAMEGEIIIYNEKDML